MKEDKCSQKDDYEEIRQKILASDGIILGSPNYAFQISASLKSLYERSHSLLYYTRRLSQKYTIGICVGGHSYMTDKIAKTIAQGIWLCGGYYVGYLGAVSVNRDELLLEQEKETLHKVEELSEKLFYAIQKKKKFWWQDFIRKRFLYPQVSAMVKNNRDKYPFLYQYYQSNNYLR
jgi:multimeric flavodoxin WrbA